MLFFCYQNHIEYGYSQKNYVICTLVIIPIINSFTTMKKLLIFSNLITLSVLGMLVMKGCSQPDKPDEANANSANLKGTQVVLDYANVKGFKSMSIAQAMILKKNYMANLPAIRKSLNIEDTESIYYSLEDLKNLVWYVEYYGKASGQNVSPEDLGVNVHFGRYPTSDLLKQFPQLEQLGGEANKAGKQTIFFVPTIVQSGKRFEFNPKKNYLEITSGRSKKIRSLSDHYKNDLSTFKMIDYDEDSPIPDFGNIQPPYLDDTK